MTPRQRYLRPRVRPQLVTTNLRGMTGWQATIGSIVFTVCFTLSSFTRRPTRAFGTFCAQPSNDTPITSTSQMDALIEGVGRTNQARWGMIFARDSPQGMMVARGKIDIARLEGDFVG